MMILPPSSLRALHPVYTPPIVIKPTSPLASSYGGCQVDQHGVKEHAGQFCSGSCRAEKKNNQKFSDFVTNARQERSLSKKGVNAGLVRTVGRSTAEKSLFTTISDQLDTDAPEPLVPRQAEQHPLVKHKYKPNATTAIDKKSARSLNISNDITAR
ncbi:hypothetical protein BLNAU_6155 [Blattamonas nauphoetae]|uniref:FLZ-type domain-containing protein n=1 Tax=Blattamonas nauphoetae TaxID=2049346 RepID=A0ABQ9Y598_9EUKA|nr:hypothetical protein BLNAU_6155 [Blattamonas nauphoetae]